ncbi:hypothetical protein N7U66_15405 [Lacinutrix neustonica]|uniref:DUF748 domain-containing protein n=1 Tax=Lacinutrix neustonica TaxID=2980107 RepID=A0A9E8MTV5_9FLAO|nr:hypothetical protein [Lacinutrix neustonica]WAC01417.1 hypothetical protein N7U66_15405 [Lacinutrix neustonica]
MKNEKDKIPKSKNKVNRILKVIGKISLSLLLLFITLILFIRSPFGQNIVVNKVVSYISNKTNTKVSIKKLFVTFDGDIQLDDLYLEDKKGDTLIYSKSLEANIPLWSMINGTGIGVDDLQWKGLRANIIRKDTINGFNFQFLIDAFATESEEPTTKTTAPLNLVLGQLDFKNIDVVYNDAVTGIDSRFTIGTLKLDMESVHLETMRFMASNIALDDANVNIFQNPIPYVEKEDASPLPFLSAEVLIANNLIVNYKSIPDLLTTNISIKSLTADIPQFNIAKNAIDVDYLTLNQSEVLLFTRTKDNIITETLKEAGDEIKEDVDNFKWPNFNISIKNVTLNNDVFGYYVNDSKPKVGTFNPSALEFKNINLVGNSLYLKENNAGINLSNASFKEASGYHLKALTVAATITDKKVNIEKLKLRLNDNFINGDTVLTYNTLSELISNPEHAHINLNLSDFEFHLSEVFAFQPALKQNNYLDKLSQQPLTGAIKASATYLMLHYPMYYSIGDKRRKFLLMAPLKI